MLEKELLLYNEKKIPLFFDDISFKKQRYEFKKIVMSFILFVGMEYSEIIFFNIFGLYNN